LAVKPLLEEREAEAYFRVSFPALAGRKT